VINGEEPAVTARDQVELIRRVLFKRWWMVALVAIVSGLSAFGTTKLLSPVYEATTTVRILKEPSLANVADHATAWRGGRLQAEAMWFTSRQVLEPVIRQLGLAETVPSSIIDMGIEKAKNVVKRLTKQPIGDQARFYDVLDKLRKKSIKVKELEGSNVLEIKVNWDDPEMTMRIANTAVDVFIEQFQTFNRARARQNRMYLEDQVRLTRKELEQSEQVLVDFQKETGLVTTNERELPGQTELQQLMVEKRQVELALEAAKAERDQIDTRLQDFQTDDEGTGNALRAALTNPDSLLRTLMARAVVTEAAMSPADVTFTEKHPASARMASELDAVQVRLREELDRLGADSELTPDDLLLMVQEEEKQAAIAENIETQLQIERSNLGARIKVYEEQVHGLDAEIAEAEEQSATLPEDLRKHLALTREKRVNEELYTMLNSRLAGAQVDENTDLYDVRVFDPAQMPIKALKPKPILMTIIGTFMGCLLGISIAFAIEYMDDSLRTAEEVESYLDLPVLAELPKVKLSRKLIAAKEVPRLA